MSYSDDAQTADPANNNNNNNNETPIRNNPLLRSANPLVSDLEQEVLDEYARLLDNVNKVCPPPPPPNPSQPRCSSRTKTKNGFMSLTLQVDIM